MSETCQRCNESGEDRRTLWMACMYNMAELELPFLKKIEGPQSFFTLRVCKACRGEWMAAIKAWFETVPARQPVGSGIFVRELGATVEVSEEEWKLRNVDREPVELATVKS